jgi:hypothetical protein
VTPDQLLAIKAISEIMKTMGAWPIGSLLAACIIGPWIFTYLNSRANDKRMEEITRANDKRLEAAIRMYEENVQLVKDYKSLVQAGQRTVETYQELVIHTTQVLTTVRNIAENNLYCPWVRKQTQETKEPRG